MKKLSVDMTQILVESYSEGTPTPLAVLAQYNLSLNELTELANAVNIRSIERRAIMFFINLTKTNKARVYQNIDVMLSGPPILTIAGELPYSLNPWYRRRLQSGPCSLCDYLNIFDS